MSISFSTRIKRRLVAFATMLRPDKCLMKPKIIGFILFTYSAFLLAACNGNSNNSKNAATSDSTTQTSLQGEDKRNGENKVYQGMEMIRSGNDLVNKGEKANDRSMIDSGMAIMDKGMDMVKSGRTFMDNHQHESEAMDDKMGAADSSKKTGFAKDMDMGDYGMNMIHQGLSVVKSGKMFTEHAQKNKDKAMMQTGMDLMDKGMAMMTMGKDMMGKDTMVMADKGMKDDMDMMDKGMNMAGMGKDTVNKAMSPADKPMMDDDMMDKGMDMMDKGMDMMEMGADKMKNDKKAMPKKDPAMKDM